MKKRNWFTAELWLTSFALLGSGAAHAQSTADVPRQETLEEIIVTGVTEETPKLEATFSINTISERDLAQLAPYGTAALLANVPGLFPEGGTAGETHNNVLVRGLPQAGGYRYVPNLLDGLPAYEEPEAPFMNNDVFIKPDLMTERLEVVKGGPGGILYSNGLGATVNYITRTGTQSFEGGYKLEVGDWGHVRNDFFVSGPINNNLTYAFGGFYRVSDGIRDPGYTGNTGGQLRGNVLYTSDDDTAKVFVQAHVIRDKTIFYQNIPYAIANTRAPGTDDNPFEVEPDKVQSLGIDFSDGTPNSHAVSFYQLFDKDGSALPLDITNGINPEFALFTVDFKKQFANDWRVEGNLRSTEGSNGFNALFVDPPRETAQVLAEQFNRIKSFSGALGAAYAPAVAVKAYYTDTVTGTDLSTATEAPSVLEHNIPVYAQVDASNLTADFRLGKLFELGSMKHDVTLGGYTSNYTYDVTSVFASAWADISKSARPIDFYAVDAAEQQVGPSITSGSVDQPAIFGLGADSTQRTNAFYFLDHFSVLDDRLKFDIGARWQELKVDRITTNSFDAGNTSNDFTPGDVVVGSTSDTLADNFVNVPDGAPKFASEEYDATGWSVGANYLLFKDSAVGDASVYAMVSDSFRLPGFEDFIFGGPATNASTGEVVRGDLVEDIRQYEGGFRIGGGQFEVSLALFYIDFKAKENLGATLDDLSATGAGGIRCSVVPAPADCPKIRDSFRRSLDNKGVELEFAYGPSFAPGLLLQGSVVYQDPKIGQNQAIRTGVVNIDTNGDGVNDSREYTVSDAQDRRPQRQSKVLVNFRPSYTFTSLPLTVFGQVFYYSERFASDNNTNVTVYPDYTQINLGASYAVSDQMNLQLNVDNVDNAESFTEGSSVQSDLRFSDGRYIGVARPLMGRSVKLSGYYRF